MHFPGVLECRPGAGDYRGTGIAWKPGVSAGKSVAGPETGPARAGRRRVFACPAARLLAACLFGLLALAAPFAAAPALAQTLSVGTGSDGTGDATGHEGDQLTFTVKMSATGTNNVTVKWRFVAGTAGNDAIRDYTSDSGSTLTISAGSTSATFTVDIVDDDTYELEETFEVEIYDASGATISRARAQATIAIDPDEPDEPIFRLDDTAVSVDEDGSAAAVRVRITANGSEDNDIIKIPYTVHGVTATAGDDFDADGGTVSFPAGHSTGTARIAIVDDPWPEGAETFEVRFATPSAGSISGAGTATVTIRAHEEVAQAASASISSTPASGDTYLAGETITVSLALSEAARVTGRPHVWLDVGGARRRADYSGPVGVATDALAFSYVVQAGDRDADGVALCARGRSERRCESIQLNGGTIRGAEDRLDALLRLPDLPAQAGHKVDGISAPPPPTACTAEIEVPHDWPLKPSGVSAGDKFRLLFVTSTMRNALSSDIADYNGFVQGRAAAGHASIQEHSARFRVLGSTSRVNARANTCTRSTDTDAAVYWLNGAKAADNYADLYDGSWDSTADRLENGNARTGVGRIWTGTNNDGTTANPYTSGFELRLMAAITGPHCRPGPALSPRTRSHKR